MKVSGVDQSVNLGHEVYVPVSVDATREVDGVEMLRATYFIVTTDAPASIWEIELPPLAGLHGLGALGMLGVVFSTLRKSEETGRDLTRFDLFADPDDVASIFDLEEEGPLSIHLEDIWIPGGWCTHTPTWGDREGSPGAEPTSRGDVFRVAMDLFQQAYRYGTGDINIDDLLAEDPAGSIYRSPRETAAFQYWADHQIDKSRQTFDSAPADLKLGWE